RCPRSFRIVDPDQRLQRSAAQSWSDCPRSATFPSSLNRTEVGASMLVSYEPTSFPLGPWDEEKIMDGTTTKIEAPSRRRGRPRKKESYADWVARIDAEVETTARQMERQPPTYAWLHPAQRRIVQMLIEHLRSLPALQQGEGYFEKPEYGWIN